MVDVERLSECTRCSFAKVSPLPVRTKIGRVIRHGDKKTLEETLRSFQRLKQVSLSGRHEFKLGTTKKVRYARLLMGLY